MLERETLLQMLRRMVRIRLFEERLKEYYDYRGYCEVSDPDDEAQSSDELLTCVGYDFVSRGVIGGAVHLSIGQEAVSVGVCSHLNDDDHIVSSHRSHGHTLAKGCSVDKALAELMGRATGLSGGYGGSMHLFDAEHGMLGGNGIVGGQIPLALGPAFAARYRGTSQVSVAFFGDGAANQGTCHESMNLAALWKLPVLFVCENNLYANTTPAQLSLPVPDVAERAHGYGMPGEAVDGQDVMAVYEVAGEAVDRARAGDGPTLIEAKTYRFEGHCGVSSGHQSPEECRCWQQRDPLPLFEAYLQENSIAGAAEFEQIRQETLGEMDDAVQFAIDSPFPEPAELDRFEA